MIEGLGWVGYGSFSMAKTQTGVSNRSLVGQAAALRGLNIGIRFAMVGLSVGNVVQGVSRNFFR